MARPFLYIYRYFNAHRIAFFSVFIGSFLLLGFLSSRIRPEEDISKILPKDAAATTLNELLHNARFGDKLVLMISLKDSTRNSPDELAAFSNAFVTQLQKEYSPFIQTIDEKINDQLVPQYLSLIATHLPVFLQPEDYPRIEAFKDSSKIKERLSDDLHRLSSPAGFLLKNLISRDPLGFSDEAIKNLRSLQYDESFDVYDSHVITKDSRYMLVFIRPAFPSDNTGKNIELLKGIDHVIAGLQSGSFAGVEANYFGSIAVAAGNATQLRKDTMYTLSISGLFLIVFLAWYFKRKRAPVLILLPVIFGGLFSLSLIYLIKGRISVIALASGSVILGIAINYSLHVYNHFRHQRNMETVIRDLSFPLTIGGLTTIGGFLSFQFVRSEILKDLGLLAAFCLIGSALASLIFLPQLIQQPLASKHKPAETERKGWISKLAGYHPEKNKWLVGVIFLVTVFLAFFVYRVGFDQDMMHMNYMPDKLKKAESTLNRINAFNARSLYVVTSGNNLENALNHEIPLIDNIQHLQQKGLVRKTSGLFKLILSDSLQEARLKYWNQYWTGSTAADLYTKTLKAGRDLGFTAHAFDEFKDLLEKKYTILSAEETAALKRGPAGEFIIEKADKTSIITVLSVEPENKNLVYQQLSGDPNITIIDRQGITAKLLNTVTADFGQIGWMVSILVFIVLWITYGRIELTLISFIPMLIAFIWILGIMGIAGLQFNIVNIILSALIFGLGDDYSLFIMDGLLQEYKTGKKNLSSYKSSIVLSAITTLVGLGVLIFAKHPALRSIALISITGIISVVLISQVLIPYLFDFLILDRVRKGRMPWTAAGLFKSIFSLTYFAVGSWIVTAIGYILVKWNPFAGSKSRLLYHRILSSYTWSVLYIMGNVKKKIINPLHEDFSTPCVMIANHKSFLDILVMTLLYPKVVLLTNNWVWNSPVFGKLVRIAGYYPVADGIENSIGYLETQVKQGYTIAIFPEGTRSPDDDIRRFHKGAFFIAEKLHLDILPLLIHGTGYTMSKSDFLLKDGYVTMKYLPRITPQNPAFGADYSERAKAIGRYFREQYSALKDEVETTAYFKEKLLYNYIYKGPVLEWYLRVKIRLENNYRIFDELLPKKGKILDMGCGYGFMSYMLQFASHSRQVTGYDYDEEKIEVAIHCFSKNNNIRFIQSDITRLNPEPSDGMVISDVLHYLQPAEQEEFVKKCFEALLPGGVILIRDGDRDLTDKHQRTKMTEFFSTRFFSFNKTTATGLHFLSGTMIRDLAAKHNMLCETVSDSSITSNMLFKITHRVNEHEKI